MNKKILSVLMVCILALGFTVGCQSQGAGESGANSEPYKVAFNARSQQDHYAVWLANEMTLAAEKYPDIQLDIFDGQGVSLEDGGNAEKEENSTVKGNAEDIPSKDYVYNLAMSHTASDEYQGQKVSIEVEVQGMQYSNTNNSDWQTLFTDGIVIG